MNFSGGGGGGGGGGVDPIDNRGRGGGGGSGSQSTTNLPDWGLGGPDVDSESVSVDAGGSLTVTPRQASAYNFMWLPDHAAGTISKFDVNSGKELARYYSISPRYCLEGERPDRGRGCTGPTGRTADGILNWPNRISIDAEGNVWVLNGGQLSVYDDGFVTKIAGTLEHCVDRNGDGVIQTSRVVENANGTLSVHMELDDECVLFSTRVCDVAVTMAISRGKEGTAGDVWVVCPTRELHNDRLYKLDSSNGRIAMDPIPLGAYFGSESIVDSKQILWLTTGNSSIQGIDTTALQGIYDPNERRRIFLGWDEKANKPALIRLDCPSYGIAADSQGRLWAASSGNWNIAACFYDHYAPEGKKRGRCELPFNGFFQPRGIAFDAQDNAYLSGGTYENHLTSGTNLTRFRWNDATGSCEFNPLMGTANTVFMENLQTLNTGGVGFDAKGNPWVTGYPTSRLNMETGKIEHATRAPPRDFSPKNPVYYFALSDFTGYQMRNLTAPRGFYRQTLSGCSTPSDWQTLSWRATVPQGSRLQAYVRVSNSNDKDAWEQAVRYGPFEASPVDLRQLNVPQSRFLQLEFVFLPAADRQSFPALHAYELAWGCQATIS